MNSEQGMPPIGSNVIELNRCPPAAGGFSLTWGGVFLLVSGLIVIAMYILMLVVLVLSYSKTLCLTLLFGLLLLFVLLVLSYVATNSTAAPTIPTKFELNAIEWAFVESAGLLCSKDTQTQLSQWANARGVRTRGYSGEVNICLECKIVKPERAHHCKRCKKCILKMDHHCPFFANCIHFANFKFFLLTLFYTTTAMLYIITTTVVCTLAVGTDWAFSVLNHNVPALLVYVAMLTTAVVAVLSVGAFFVSSLYHAMHNHTTLEHIGGSVLFANGSKHTYDIGNSCENLKQQFGPSILAWLLPINTTPGDGVTFPVRSRFEELSEVTPTTSTSTSTS